MTSADGDPAGGPAGVVPAAPAGRGDGTADDRSLQPVRAGLRPLAGPPRPAADAGRADPARHLGVAGRARRDARALHRGHPAARDAPVLPLASHRRRTGEAPTDGIEIPSPPDEPVPVLTDTEIATLLKACAVGRGRPGVVDRAAFLGRRDEVVPRLLLDTGVRVSEPCGLALDDVDLDLDRELADHVRRELGNLAFEVHTKAAQPLAY